VNAEQLQAAVNAVPYWYHKIELPGGIVTPGWAPTDAKKYQIPERLDGKRVLDVGAWDGYWTFEALKRGAMRVEAIDDFSDTVGTVTNADRSEHWRTFDMCADALGYRIGFLEQIMRTEMSVYQIDERWEGSFDAIFCFGVLYHLRHPLYALERLRTVCNVGATIYIETATLEHCKSAYSDRTYRVGDFASEFYPNDECGMNHSNWWVCTLPCWCAMVEAAGFKVEASWVHSEFPDHISECRGYIRATAKI